MDCSDEEPPTLVTRVVKGAAAPVVGEAAAT